MNDLRIQSHLAIPTFLCIIGLVAIFVYRRSLFARYKWFWASITVFFVLYLWIVGYALYTDIYYQWDLHQYDLDNDGTYGGEEVTEEQQAAMQRLTNDVGRNFAFITGFKLAITCAAVVYCLGTVISSLLRSKRS